MKLVRILLYEGSETVLREHVKKCFVDAERPFESSSMTNLKIQEIFRGTSTAIVEHLSVTEFSADEMDADTVKTGGEKPDEDAADKEPWDADAQERRNRLEN